MYIYISITGANTLRPCWYLVQIRLEDSNTAAEGQYFVHLFRRHPNDSHKKDNMARYWPNWYAIKWVDEKKEYFDYCRPVLVQPRRTPCLKKHCRFSNTVELLNEDVFLTGPFNFMPKPKGTPGGQMIDDEQRASLVSRCQAKGLVPPNLSFETVMATNMCQSKIERIQLPGIILR